LPRREWIEAAAASAALLFFRLFPAPAEPAWNLCGFLWLTGLPCPLCGMTRGLCAAAKGQWAQALQFHALSPIVLACIALWAGVSLLRLSGRFRRPAFPWSTAAVALVGYGVLRVAARTL
jgi:hypothetical protein